METERDWSELLPELLSLIASRLRTMEEFIAFRGVCTSWRTAAGKEDKFASLCKLPLLMLSRDKFYSLSKRRTYTRIAAFPGATGKNEEDFRYVGFGWILIVASLGKELSLVKPFSSSARIELPSYFPLCRGGQAFLTANPSETSDFKLLLLVFNVPAFCRNGDKKWTLFGQPPVESMCYYGSLLYTLDFYGRVLIWDPQGTDLQEPQGIVNADFVQSFRTFSQNTRWNDYMVVNSKGEMLRIKRHPSGGCHFNKGDFTLWVVNLVDMKWVEIDGLGNDAIFVGRNVAVCVDTTEFPGVLKPNSIYFTDDSSISYVVNNDIGIYNFETRRIERFDIKTGSDSALWLFPWF